MYSRVKNHFMISGAYFASMDADASHGSKTKESERFFYPPIEAYFVPQDAEASLCPKVASAGLTL